MHKSNIITNYPLREVGLCKICNTLLFVSYKFTTLHKITMLHRLYSEKSPEAELQPMIEIAIISVNLILNAEIVIDYQTVTVIKLTG